MIWNYQTSHFSLELCAWHDHLKHSTFLWGKPSTRCCFNSNNWLKEHSLQLSPTKFSKRTIGKFLEITFQHLSLWGCTWRGSIQQSFLCKNTHLMILFSNDLKWNNHVVCIWDSASFNINFQIIWQSHIGFIIISYLFWMGIDMDFSDATASKNMLLSHKTAMWNKQFVGWINGWMDGWTDWLNDW